MRPIFKAALALSADAVILYAVSTGQKGLEI